MKGNNMGDMADWTNDNGSIEYMLYGPGGLKSCRYCGEHGLHWVNIGTPRNPVWRLVKESIIHICFKNETFDIK
jgi:hypothetical protein